MDGGPLKLGRRTLVMGVVNVTPDSFSDGGDFYDTRVAIEQGLRLAEEGADILDIGGESARPYSDPVSTEEELRRVIPVIEALAAEVSVPISIDTVKSEVARRALDAGASMLNDVSALRDDDSVAEVAAETGVPIILMHMLGTPKTMQVSPSYRSLISEIISFLDERLTFAESRGVDLGQVIVDPGIGFGKTFDQNLTIINNLGMFAALDRPIMIGPSRKAFLGRILDKEDPKMRDIGTVACVAAGIINGCHLVRVHNAALGVEAARVADAIINEQVESY